MSKIVLGAPSLSGKDANELVAVAFKGAVFPLDVTVTNLIGHSLSFPEVSGLFITASYEVKPSVVVEIKDNDALQRLASSIEQIAELNDHEAMLAIEWEVDPELVADDESPEKDEVIDEPALDAVIEPKSVVDTGKKAGKKAV